MKIIRDNIWGDISFSDIALKWIDTDEFQRLHNIRQTGLAYRVFPTATTTRFAHSLGVYHVLKSLLENLQLHQPDVIYELGGEKLEWICLAGLLHDIGHGPFSHSFDDYLLKKGESVMTHEARSIQIILYMNNKYGFLPLEAIAFIASLIKPLPTDKKRWFSHLVHNPEGGVDVDKMDYLVRDNHQFGLCMSVDVMRIIKNCRVIDDILCFRDKVQDEIWSLFLIRHRLHSTIYRHPRISKFEKEIHSILELMEEKEHFTEIMLHRHDIRPFLKWTDPYILFHADPAKLHEFHSRSSGIVNKKERTPFLDDQFSKLKRIWFYHQDDLSVKFYLPFPSIYCPFAIPI